MNALHVAELDSEASMTFPKQEQRYLTRAQVADVLGMSVEWVRSRLADESIPYFKLGRSIRISVDDLAAFLDGSRNSGGIQ